MNAAENARLAYLGSNQAECAPWAELKPEIRERWDRVVRTVKQDAHYDDADIIKQYMEDAGQFRATIAELRKEITGLRAELSERRAEQAPMGEEIVRLRQQLHNMNAIRKLLTQGDDIRTEEIRGVEHVPLYVPERASDEELEHVFEQGREEGALVNMEGIRAVRSRVEAPLLAEIARLGADCAWNKQAADSLRARVAELEAKVKALSEIDENGLSALSELVGLRMQLTAMTEAAEEMERVCGLHNKRIHDQESEIDTLRAELESEREKSGRFDGSAQVLSKIVDDQKRELETVKVALDGRDAQIQVLKLSDAAIARELDAVMAERDAAQDDAAAIFDIASQDDADTPLEAVRKLKEYADTIEWREAHTESANNSLLEQLAALRQLTTATPTAAEVEALARVLRDAHWEHHGLSKQDDAAPGFYSACARAAYAHIVRVPVGCELDVTAEELAAKMWGFFDAEDMASKILDHCRSRIKPIYECKECAKLRDEVMFWKRENVAANNQMLSAIATLQAPRAALEGE